MIRMICSSRKIIFICLSIKLHRNILSSRGILALQDIVSHACATNASSDHISSNDTIMVLYKKKCACYFYLYQGERKGKERTREIVSLAFFFQRSNQRIFLCSIDLLARVCNNRQTILLRNHLNTTPDYYIVSL